MAVTGDQMYRSGPHPVHAILLAGTIPLFLGALLSDIAYWSSYEIQWSNFASWLIVGGLIFTAFALLCALIGLVPSDQRERSSFAYILLLLFTWIVGFISALVHARDAWAIMPEALILSAIVIFLALLATRAGFRGHRQGGAR